MEATATTQEATMYRSRVTIFIVARKRRTGQLVSGSFSYDGLADLWPVAEDNGEITYVSCLDEVLSWEEVA
jgi:hypothetical protein